MTVQLLVYVITTVFTYILGKISKHFGWNETLPIPIQNILIGIIATIIGCIIHIEGLDANSIIQANAYSDNCIVKFEIVDKLQHNWTVNLHNFDVKKETDGKVIELFSNVPFRQNLLGVISRNLEEVDSIRVRIYSQQYAHPWGAVNLFIDDGEEQQLLDGDDNYLVRLGYFNREGVYFRLNNVPQKVEYNSRTFSIELLLCREYQRVAAYLCDGNKQYLLSSAVCNELNQGNWKIGVQIRQNDSVYPHWFFRNFLQISCDLNSVNRPLDFMFGIEKDWHFYWVNQFLETSKIPFSFVKSYGMMKFIRNSIDEGKYIELRLDQYYISDREEYRHRHFMHQNLIYGYDDSLKILYLLGYNSVGKMSKTTISYADVKYQFNKRGCVSNVYLIEYKPEAYGVTYQPEYIRRMLIQYLESYNSSLDFGHIIEARNRVFGFACYAELMSEKGLNLILKDRRVLHLLYEHKFVMEQRLEYLAYFENHNAKIRKCFEDYNDIVGSALNIRNLALKYQINGDEKIRNKIFNSLKEMMDKEKKILSEVVGLLS